MSSDRRISPGDPGYPRILAEIPDPPKCLYLRGAKINDDNPAVGIVGSRNPTPYGRHMARLIAGGLAANGVTIVSGFARGIDTEAHNATLEKNGSTVAVLGSGLDIDYPRGSRELAGRIIEKGTLVSEFEPGTPPLPRNFPARNRIISGLSLAVVVIQSGLKSGSLITARWALDQGRDVMAVPGRADDPLSSGPISLIRDGAAPVCSAADILDILGLKTMALSPTDPGIDGSEKSWIMIALQPGPRLPEDLAHATGQDLPQVLSELSKLELEGLVFRDAGGNFVLK